MLLDVLFIFVGEMEKGCFYSFSAENKIWKKIILEKDVILPNKETIEVCNLGTVENPRYVVTENTVRKELSTHKVCESCGNNISKNSEKSNLHNNRR